MLWLGLLSVSSIVFWAGFWSLVDTRTLASLRMIRSLSLRSDCVLISFYDPLLRSWFIRDERIVCLAGVFWRVTLANESLIDILVISAMSIS